MKAAAFHLCTNIQNIMKNKSEAVGSSVLIAHLQTRGALRGLKEKDFITLYGVQCKFSQVLLKV